MKCVIVHKVFSAMQVLQDERNQPFAYEGEWLSPAEIAFLHAVKDNPGANATQLSEHLDVTRSAVSQWSRKLEEKGLLGKSVTDDNKKEKIHTVTEAGHRICAQSAAQYEEANERLCRYLSGLSASDKEVILRFLDALATTPVRHFECHAPCYSHETA